MYLHITEEELKKLSKVGLYSDTGHFIKDINLTEKLISVISKVKIDYNKQTEIQYNDILKCACCGGENLQHKYWNNSELCHACESNYNNQ